MPVRKVNVLTLAAVGTLIFAAAWYGRVAVHEAGHALAAIAAGAEHIGVTISLFTGHVTWSGGDVNKIELTLIYLAGSFSVAIVALLLVRNKLKDALARRGLIVIGIVAVVLEVVNMFPARAGTDGAKVAALWGGWLGYTIQGVVLVVFAGLCAYFLLVSFTGRERMRLVLTG